MNLAIDAALFTGQFPFRAVARATLRETRARMDSLNIARAVVSPIEAVFQEDSWEAEERLAREITGQAAFIQFKIVNPRCAWWQADLDRALRHLGVKGIRLIPGYHQYALNDERLHDVMAYARSRDLPVQVFCRMQDSRMQWLLRTAEAGAEEALDFLIRYAENRMVLSGLHYSDMTQFGDALEGHGHVLLDTSRLKGPWKTFERLAEKLNLAHVCFGSLWPINLPDCPMEQVRHAGLSDSEKVGILGGNLAGLLRLDA